MLERLYEFFIRKFASFLWLEIMKTSGIREDDGKGRHTTTYRQMIELANGVTIIDTPDVPSKLP